MKEAIVTVKFTETEIDNLYYALNAYISSNEKEIAGGVNIPLVKANYYKLKGDLMKIKKWIKDTKHEAEIDKRVSEESPKEQTKMETI